MRIACQCRTKFHPIAPPPPATSHPPHRALRNQNPKTKARARGKTLLPHCLLAARFVRLRKIPSQFLVVVLPRRYLQSNATDCFWFVGSKSLCSTAAAAQSHHHHHKPAIKRVSLLAHGCRAISVCDFPGSWFSQAQETGSSQFSQNR